MAGMDTRRYGLSRAFVVIAFVSGFGVGFVFVLDLGFVSSFARSHIFPNRLLPMT